MRLQDFSYATDRHRAVCHFISGHTNFKRGFDTCIRQSRETAHQDRGDLIDRAFTLDFLTEALNLVLVGRNGLGKTMIAHNLCHTAVLAGHSVLFRSASALLEEFHRQSPEGLRRKLRTYANVGLLCIDEMGYLYCDDKAADLLYEVVNYRYERRLLILTTNRPFTE